ncbi:MAG: glycosyltransferase [Bacteroidota bacterium]|nr:glycosyltransferase [Bacteroidota bacterium]
MPPENTCVYIIVPIHNRIKITEIFINCLLKQTYKNYHLLLIDDGSTDGTEIFVKKMIKSLTLIKGNGNLWVGGCFQKGYKWLINNAKGSDSIVLLINNDTYFEENFLETAVKLMDINSQSILLAKAYDLNSGILFDQGKCIDWKRFKINDATPENPANCFSTRGLFLRFSDMLKIGEFHNILLPHYGGDYEYTIRAYRKGYKLITDENLKLWITNEPTGIQNKYSRTIFSLKNNVFSKRNPMNPYYLTIFLIFACPFRYFPRNLIRVWYRGLNI